MRNLAKLCIVLLTSFMVTGCVSTGSSDVTNAQQSAALVEAPTGDLFSISPGSVDDPDIVWSKRIPVVGDEVKLSARVRGRGKHPVDVCFILEAPSVRKATLWAKPGTQQDSDRKYVDYEATWQPEKTGFYTLTVQVDPHNKSGDPFPNNNAATVIIPVTWQQLHIIAWGTQKHCKWVGTGVSVEKSSAEEIAYWHRRGSLVLGYMYTIERNLMKLSEEDMVEQIVNKAGRYAAQGCDGLILDETGSYPTPDGFEFIRRFGVAYDKVREKYPHLQVYNWIAGGLQREELEIARRNGHILMGETYEAIHARGGPTFPRFVAGRVERLVRPSGVAGGIIALGVGGDCGRKFRPQIENSVRLCRKLAPEMPGICYYGVGYPEEGAGYEGSFNEFLDKITLKYFIKPVLMVDENDIWLSDCSPNRNRAVELQVRVHNIGGMAAKNIGVKIYARQMSINKRTLVASIVIPEIGNGMLDIKEDDSASEDYKVINGTKYPIARWGNTTRVLLNRALVDVSWTPKKSGYYKLEVEVQPSQDYTVLEGFAERLVPVAEKSSGQPSDKSAYNGSARPVATVTENDLWLSDYSPTRKEPVSVQVRVHNIGKTAARNVGVKIYARHLGTNKRALLASTVIPEIGIEVRDIKEDKPVSGAHKIVNGTKYPAARWASTARVFFNRALVDTLWTPEKSGHYRLEVELRPSQDYTIGEGLAQIAIAVGG